MEHVDRLIAIERIRALKARYCRLLDGKCWTEWGELFTESATLDASEDVGGDVSSGAGIPGEALMHGRAGIVDQVRRLLDAACTIHHVHSPEITLLSNDEALGVWAMEDRVMFPSDGLAPFRALHGYGHYHERYRFEGERWLICSTRLTRLHREIER